MIEEADRRGLDPAALVTIQCRSCHGRGAVEVRFGTWDWHVIEDRPCMMCAGEGQVEIYAEDLWPEDTQVED